MTIDAPPDGTLVADPPGGFTLTGTASVGEGLPVKDTTLVFTMDRSGSMGLSAGVDCTGDGSADTRMVCQKEGVATVLQAAADPLSTVDLLGLASFSDGGTAHDVNLGAGGTQLLVSPTLDSDGDGVADIEEVARGLSPGGATSYGAGLAKTVDILNDAANSTVTTASCSWDHTVTATVAAGPDGGAPAVSVDFDVLSGANAGAGGSGVTDSSGEVAFTYPATQGLAGLGTDTIRACFTDDLGNELCSQATKEWVDTTPPDPGCAPADNPAGNEPQAGNRSPGQNEDGYYQLTALDAVDPDPEIFLVDTGSGTVFGPFTHGTTVKYTQSPGATPTQKQIGGPGSQVQWHIKGTGDAAVFAVDASGNESAQVRCLVPPQPQ